MDRTQFRTSFPKQESNPAWLDEQIAKAPAEIKAHLEKVRPDVLAFQQKIADIEKEAYEVDPEVRTEDLGIRFYYAAYPEDPQEPIPADYAKRHTLIMVPTKKKDDLNYDFNPYEDSSHALAVTLEVSGRAVAQNHGALIPPGTSIVESY